MNTVGIIEELNSSLEQVRIVALVAAVFIYIIPPLNWLISRFFTTIHELGHALAARFANGSVIGVWVFGTTEQGAKGVTSYQVPENAELLIMHPAGYMGVPLFTTFLIISGNLPDNAPLILGSTGGVLFLMFLLYGKQGRHPDIPLQRVATALVWMPMSVSFIAIAWLLDPLWSVLTLNLLAVLGSVESIRALRDLKQALRQLLATNQSGGSDPEKMAQEFENIPFLKHPMFWVHVWSISSILMLGAAYWLTWFGGAPVLAQG
jgi:hypothetical protein